MFEDEGKAVPKSKKLSQLIDWALNDFEEETGKISNKIQPGTSTAICHV